MNTLINTSGPPASGAVLLVPDSTTKSSSASSSTEEVVFVHSLKNESQVQLMKKMIEYLKVRGEFLQVLEQTSDLSLENYRKLKSFDKRDQVIWSKAKKRFEKQIELYEKLDKALEENKKPNDSNILKENVVESNACNAGGKANRLEERFTDHNKVESINTDVRIEGNALEEKDDEGILENDAGEMENTNVGIEASVLEEKDGKRIIENDKEEREHIDEGVEASALEDKNDERIIENDKEEMEIVEAEIEGRALEECGDEIIENDEEGMQIIDVEIESRVLEECDDERIENDEMVIEIIDVEAEARAFEERGDERIESDDDEIQIIDVRIGARALEEHGDERIENEEEERENMDVGALQENIDGRLNGNDEEEEQILAAEGIPQESYPQYTLGSLLWAKIGHHPYWPCMVSYDPNTGLFFKLKQGRNGVIAMYHVQYFGKHVSHGWTANDNLYFEGVDKFLSLRDREINAATTEGQKKKLKKKFFIPTSVLDNWRYAVKDAEKAQKVRHEDRYEMFVYKYQPKNTEKEKVKSRKRKRHSINKKKVEKAILTIPSNIVEPLCDLCEKGSVDLFCSSGICKKYFHKECLGIVYAPADFQCVNCSTDKKQPCVICKCVASDTEKCIKCDIFYHDYCIESYKSADIRRNICSAHVCRSCYVRNPRNGASKGPFVTCFRCPTSYHDTLNCLPVGCARLSPNVIVCPQHFLGKNKVSPQCNSNVNLCQACFEGGELICCESCPNAYHATCIDGEVPIGDFYCDDCSAKKDLYCEMIVWAKTGNHRWWPAQIVDVKDLPQNVKNFYPRFDGEFPILFFGTDEYGWTHRGKVLPYNEKNSHLNLSSGKSSNQKQQQFVRSLEEAAEAYEAYQQKHLNTNSRPSPFRHIRVNRAVLPATIINSASVACNCNITDENPCGSDHGCLNRTTKVECHIDTCRAREKCQNQRFVKRTYAKVKVFKTSNCGFGLKACQFIPEGSFVIEYVGEVITTEEYERRTNQMRRNNAKHYYFLYLDSKRIIDAGPSGNLSRFINHSCNPNCAMEKWSVNADLRIGIFALRDIQAGEEITFNYQSEVDVGIGQECNCGASNCFGIIGQTARRIQNRR